MSEDKRNEARRFMTLIDALYEAKVKLVMSAEAPPEKLYPSGHGAFESALLEDQVRLLRRHVQLVGDVERAVRDLDDSPHVQPGHLDEVLDEGAAPLPDLLPAVNLPTAARAVQSRPRYVACPGERGLQKPAQHRADAGCEIVAEPERRVLVHVGDLAELELHGVHAGAWIAVGAVEGVSR